MPKIQWEMLAAVFGVGSVPAAVFPHMKSLFPKAASSFNSFGSSCGSGGGGGCGVGCGGCGG